MISNRLSLLSQFFSASGTYYVLSVLFPAKETYLDHPILADDASAHEYDAEHKREDQSSLGEKGSVVAEVKSLKL